MIVNKIHKKYRTDIKKYETKYSILGFISFYVFSIWRKGKIKRTFSFFQGKPKYLNEKEPIKIYISSLDFLKKYNCNKWRISNPYDFYKIKSVTGKGLITPEESIEELKELFNSCEKLKV